MTWLYLSRGRWRSLEETERNRMNFIDTPRVFCEIEDGTAVKKQKGTAHSFIGTHGITVKWTLRYSLLEIEGTAHTLVQRRRTK